MVVLGIFFTRARVELAVTRMQRDGFRDGDISVLFSCNEDTKEYVLAKVTERSDAAAAHHKARAAIGGSLGWLAGIDILDIPGLGQFMAAGPIREFFSDNRITPVGGLTGCLIRTGIDEQVARVYAVCVRAGCTLVSVHADDFKWIRMAQDIFQQTGARNIVRTPETAREYAHPDKPEARPAGK